MRIMPEITLILQNIRSSHNVGAIFRTAEGFGVEKIILSGYTPYPKIDHDPRLPHIADKLTAQIHKTALGAETMVPFEYREVLDSWLRENQDGDNMPIIGLEQAKNSKPLPHFQPPEKFALILGEEVHGIDDHYLAYCDYTIEIPMVGKKESFNVSVATGIALYGLVYGQTT